MYFLMKSRLNLLLLLGSMLLGNVDCMAQFSKMLGNKQDNVFTRIKSEQKNTLACGYTISPADGLPHATFSHLDANGNVLWTTTLDNPSKANDFEIITDEPGAPAAGYLVVGNTEPSTTSSNNQSFIAKFNANGSLAWVKLYQQTGREGFLRIVRRNNPQPQHPYYFITGFINDAQSNPSSYDDGIIWVMDGNGTQIKRWRYEDPTAYDNELGSSIINWDSDKLMVAGNRLDNAGGRYGVVYTINETGGNVILSRRLPNQQIIRDIYRYQNNGSIDVLISGYDYSTQQAFIAKLKGADLSVIWWHAVSDQKNLYDIGTDSSNKIYVTGETNSNDFSILCIKDAGLTATVDYAYQVTEPGSTNFTEGHLWVRPGTPNLLYADARNRGANGFGGLDIVVNRQNLDWSNFQCGKKLERVLKKQSVITEVHKLTQYNENLLDGQPAKATLSELPAKDFCGVSCCEAMPSSININGASCFCWEKNCNQSLGYNIQLPPALQNCSALQIAWTISPNVPFSGQSTNQINVNCKDLKPGVYVIKVTLKCQSKTISSSFTLTVCEKVDPGFTATSNGSSLVLNATPPSPGQHYWFLVKDNNGDCNYQNGEQIQQGNSPIFQFNGLATNQQYVLYHVVFNSCNPTCYCISSKRLCFKWFPNSLKQGALDLQKIEEISVDEAKLPQIVLEKVKSSNPRN